MQETSLHEPSHYTESSGEKLRNVCPNNQLCTNKLGSHCTLLCVAMLCLIHTITDE